MRYDEKNLFPKYILEMEAKMKATHALRMSRTGRFRSNAGSSSQSRTRSQAAESPQKKGGNWNKVLMKRPSQKEL